MTDWAETNEKSASGLSSSSIGSDAGEGLQGITQHVRPAGIAQEHQAQVRREQRAARTPVAQRAAERTHPHGDQFEGGGVDDGALAGGDLQGKGNEIMAEEEPRALRVVGEISAALLGPGVGAIEQFGVHSDAGGYGEIAGTARALDASQGNAMRGEAEDSGCGLLGTVGEAEIVGQHVAGAEGDDAHHGRAPGHALESLEDRTVAAAGEDRIATSADGGTGLASGGASGLGRFDENLDSGATEDLRDAARW